MTATPPSSTPAPSPVAPDFDAALWKAVNAAFDEALETDELSRPAFLARLAQGDPRVANEVRRLLGRAHAQTLVTNVVRHPLAGLTTHLAPVLGDSTEKGFDGLLQRALRADRARAKNKRHVGELCGAWRLEEIIGVGGMGEVWLATRADGLYQAKAAVKFLKSDVDSERFEARFAQERSLLARLNHPGIARLIDAGRLFGQPFLVLEYIEGSPLLNYVAERAKTVDARIAIIREIGEAVAYAHSQLVVHRDLKPSNVLVTPSGYAKLLDFGVAGLLENAEHDETTSSEVTKMAGRGLTVEYAAPELITGEASGVASDIYSIAALAYHLLAGHRAHTPEKPGRAALEHAVLHVVPPRVSEAARARPPQNTKDNIPPPADAARLEGDIDAIIARALRVDPADRYRSMEAFVSDLRRWAERRPIAARREDRSYRTKLWLRRNWLPVGLTATLLVALTAGLAVSIWQYQRAQTEAVRAHQATEFLVDIFRKADPDFHGGEWASSAVLLEQARAEVGQRFSDVPETQERLNATLAGIYLSLGRVHDALPMAEQSLTSAVALFGANSPRALAAEATLCTVLAEIGRGRDAQPRLGHLLEKTARLSRSEPMLYRAALLAAFSVYLDMRRPVAAEETLSRYSTFVASTGQMTPWDEAEIDGKRALILSVTNDLLGQLALLKKHEAQYLNPPEKKTKAGLFYLSTLIKVQLDAGDTDGLQASAYALVTKWDSLAGRTNQHSVRMLDEIAFFETRRGSPALAKRAYLERVDRLIALPNVNLEVEFAQLDLLEVDTLFALAPRTVLRQRFDELMAKIDAATDQTAPGRLFRFRWRLLYVAAALDNIAAMEKLLAQASQFVTNEKLTDGPDLRSFESARNTLAIARGRLKDVVPVLYAQYQTRKPQRGTYHYFAFTTRVALLLALANAPQTPELLRAAQDSRPRELGDSHRLVLALRYAEALAASTDANSAAALAAREAFARSIGRQSAADVPESLHGLFFY